MIEEDLPFSERALLLAMANDWFRESKEALDGSEKEKSELEAKLKELEKKLWLLKLNAEVEKLDKVNFLNFILRLCFNCQPKCAEVDL